MSKQVRLTLPDDLYKTLKEQAGKDDRTIANYILHLLKKNKSSQSPTPIYFQPGVRDVRRTILNPENPYRETNYNLHKWTEK